MTKNKYVFNKSWSHYKKCDGIGLYMTINHTARISFRTNTTEDISFFLYLNRS